MWFDVLWNKRLSVAQVHFDGWHEKFDFWVDSDLPDLHPVGWCSRTGHPLEPPLSESLLTLTIARQTLDWLMFLLVLEEIEQSMSLPALN